MPSSVFEPTASYSPEVECGHCRTKLPLRLSKHGERGSVWLCSECSVPFVSLCIKDRLAADARSVKLDERYFDTEGLPPISANVRREVARIAERAKTVVSNDQRRSERVTHSLVVPAIKLDSQLNPFGRSFQVMVADISREGVGIVHNAPIESEYIALKLPLDAEKPIQVVTRLVREQAIREPLRQFGGEFFVRLGSVAEEV